MLKLLKFEFRLKLHHLFLLFFVESFNSPKEILYIVNIVIQEFKLSEIQTAAESTELF